MYMYKMFYFVIFRLNSIRSAVKSVVKIIKPRHVNILKYMLVMLKKKKPKRPRIKC